MLTYIALVYMTSKHQGIVMLSDEQMGTNITWLICKRVFNIHEAYEYTVYYISIYCNLLCTNKETGQANLADWGKNYTLPNIVFGLMKSTQKNLKTHKN